MLQGRARSLGHKSDFMQGSRKPIARDCGDEKGGRWCGVMTERSGDSAYHAGERQQSQAHPLLNTGVMSSC